MALIRWQKVEPTVWPAFPHPPLWRDALDRLFDSPLLAPVSCSRQFRDGWLPAVSLSQDRDQLILRAELPGMKKEDINISLQDEVLTLSGERRETDVLAQAKAHRAERFFGKFQRTLTLPLAVDPNKVQAIYENGLLTVTLPKAGETKPQSIEVNVQ
jgi:HSP20 family protein